MYVRFKETNPQTSRQAAMHGIHVCTPIMHECPHNTGALGMSIQHRGQRTNTNARTYTHACARAHVHARTRVCMDVVPTCATHTCRQMRLHSCNTSHPPVLRRTSTCTRTCTHACIRVHARTHACTHARTHTRTRACMHLNIHHVSYSMHEYAARTETRLHAHIHGTMKTSLEVSIATCA